MSGYYGPEQCDGGDPWNPAGFGTMFESFPFPIFMTTDESVESEVVQCFENFNRPSDDSEPGSWPLCALELKAHMYSSTDTTTCLRDQLYKIALPGKSILGDYFQENSTS